ncbi:serine hydrolase domain-containing protein [Thermocatellispora tengchongensis]
MIVAGRVAELAGEAPLDVLVTERVTGPLGMADTGYRPRAALLPRIAATEDMPGRPGAGCVRGEVHDETAYALGGVAGHAGLFGTAPDLLRFGEMLRTGEGGALTPASIAEMTRDQGAPAAGYGQGLAIRIGDPSVAGPLAGALGHTGFTGTSLLVSPARRLTAVLLTNSVHPRRGRPGIARLRTAVARLCLRLTGG